MSRPEVEKVKPKEWIKYLLLIDCKKRKIDDVLLEQDVLPHVLTHALHLNSYSQIEWTILGKFYNLGFVVGPLLHAQKFSVSPSPLGTNWVFEVNLLGLGCGWA